MERLRQIVYVSSASRILRQVELLGILEASRVNNYADDITGLLLYADGAFIQVLEGEAARVECLIRKIRRDGRHRQFLILLDRVADERDFEGWSMGFRRVTVEELDTVARYSDWSAEMPMHRRNAAAVRLIESFRRTVELTR